MIHTTFTPAEPIDIDRPTIGAVLQMLDARRDPLSAAAARIIRSQEVSLLSLEAEITEAEWRAMSHAVEIDRMKDHRRAWEERRAMKAGKR